MKTPLSNSLQEKVANVSNQTPSSTKVTRRHPAAAIALHSSELAKIYCEIGKEKLGLLNIEKALMKEQADFETKKQKLELQILEAELQIKQKQLNRLQLNLH